MDCGDIVGDLRDKDTCSGSEHDEVKLSKAHCVILQICSSIHHQQGNSLYLLTSPRQSLSPLLWTRLNSPVISHAFICTVYFSRVRRPLGHVTSPSRVGSSFRLQLTNPLLVSASNSLPTLRATSKAICFEVAEQWHFRAEELVYPAAVNCHICRARPFD